MIYRVFVFIVFCNIIICGAGCNKNSAAHRNDHLRFNKTLPNDWPVPSLDFSADVALREASSSYYDLPNLPKGQTYKMWYAGVHCDGSWEGITDYMAARLATRRYKKLFVTPNAEPDIANYTFHYYSADGLTDIKISPDIMFFTGRSDNESSSDIAKYFETAQEFKVVINVSNFQDELFQEALKGDPSDRIRLEPLQ